MKTSDILKKLNELREQYSNTDFPFDRFSNLAHELKALKHLYAVSEKINKGDRAVLGTLEEGSKEYERRSFLLSQDAIEQSLRLTQIEGMTQELDALAEKLSELIER